MRIEVRGSCRSVANLFRRVPAVCVALSLSVMSLLSCSNEKANGDGNAKNNQLVINEIMASNRTGLMAEDGRVYDWIEIKNNSSESVSLAGYSLQVRKGKKAKKKEQEEGPREGEESDGEDLGWKFPDMKLGPGECLVVFASKKDVSEAGQELHTDFKLASKECSVRLLDDDGEVVSEVGYDDLDGDQCYRRTANGEYEKSYEATPGTENTEKGFEVYNALIDGQRESELLLWEMQTKGDNPWVEVKNMTDSVIDLTDFSLVTKSGEVSVWNFPSRQLAAGATYVVDCLREGIDMPGSESVALVKDGDFMDGACGKPAPYGATVGRVKGQKGFFFLDTPTRGNENTGKFYRFIAPKPAFKTASGIYDRGDSVMSVLLDTHGYKARYTVDGNWPTAVSPAYKDTIEIDKTTVIRAYCEGDSSHMRSTTATGTYFLNENHKVAVVNIAVNESDLYDYNRGIYVEGPGAQAEFPHEGANYWQTWWKNAHVEFYDGKDSFEADCGLAIFGGFSRTLDKKCFKIKFKDIYGPSNVKFDIFREGKPIKMKTLVFRSGSQDVYGVMARDEFFTSLMKSTCPTLLVQDYRPVALYVNAKYFGLYYVRDKIDKHFVSRHLGVSKDSVTITMNEMADRDYRQVINYERSHDVTKKETYDYVCERIDINSLIDWKLAEIYASKTDLGNARFARSTQSTGDNKWRAVLYDLDYSWSGLTKASLYLRPNDDPKSAAHNVLINDLLRNKDFRADFLKRLSMHLHKTFSPEYATSVFDNLMATIQPEMERNCKRWPQFMSYAAWQERVKAFRKQFKNRPKVMLNDLRKELAITPEEDKEYFSDI